MEVQKARAAFRYSLSKNL